MKTRIIVILALGISVSPVAFAAGFAADSLPTLGQERASQTGGIRCEFEEGLKKLEAEIAKDSSSSDATAHSGR